MAPSTRRKTYAAIGYVCHECKGETITVDVGLGHVNQRVRVDHHPDCTTWRMIQTLWPDLIAKRLPAL